jgi:hypothetical protein
MRKLFAFGVALALVVPAAAIAGKSGFSVRAAESDPGRTYLVQAEWLRGVGCPTNARTYDGSTHGTYTDPACATGDKRDRKNEGLLLAKTGPIANWASATAEIKGFKGRTLTELGWDIRKPNGDPGSPRGSHCDNGSPRWNITTKDGTLFFVGCRSPLPVATAGAGFQRHRWGAGGAPLMASHGTTGVLTNIEGMKVKRLQLVFDDGQDTLPTNFGLAVLDNIDVNGKIVGRDSGDRDDD